MKAIPSPTARLSSTPTMSSRRSICTATGTPNGTLREELGAEDHVNDHEFITDGPPAEQRPQGKKRRASTKAKQGGKPSPKKYRGIRGKLEGMNEMPLDIWHEVCPGCPRSSSPLCSKRHTYRFSCDYIQLILCIYRERLKLCEGTSCLGPR